MPEQIRFEEFSTLISCIHNTIQKIKTRYTMQLGLKAVHVFWIYLLRTHPEGLSASELAAAGNSNRSLVSREINELFDKGLVFTHSESGKRRYGWKLMLTKKGQELADVIAAVVTDIQNTVSQNIPESELISFYRTLETLAKGFEELEKNSSIPAVISQWQNR